MSALAELDAYHIGMAMRRYFEALTEHRSYLNSLNVYPVPDGDTGTNMMLTLKSVVEAIDELPDDGTISDVCQCIGKASLMGARGNSGVILSQILRTFFDALAGAEMLDGEGFAQGAKLAADAAYKAVLRPVEGTILTVMRHLAQEAEAAAGAGGELVEVLNSALEAGRSSLERTPELLEVLKLAGVVDAGGAGLLLLLEAFVNVTDGTAMTPAGAVAEAVVVGADSPGIETSEESSVADLRYEVMFLLQSDDDRVRVFQERWGEVGDSIVVVGGDGLWNCHIHTDDIGAAIESGIEAGRPYRIEVTDLLEQAAHVESVPAPPLLGKSGVVAVAAGDGIREMFETLGVGEVVIGGQTMNPSAADLKRAAERLLAEEVIVLPNNKNIIPVAEQLQEVTEKTIVVLPTRSIPEGLSAMLGFDPDAEAVANGEQMRAASAGVAHGEVTKAVRDSVTPLGEIREGDFMGISAEGVQVVAGELVKATCGLLEKLLRPSHELVTLVVGEDASEGDTEKVKAWLEEKRPGVELDLHAGGQPLYHYLIGVE